MSMPPPGSNEPNPYGQSDPYGKEPPAYGQQPAYGQPPGYPMPYGGGYNAQPVGPPPPNYLVWSIVTMLLCTIPGIVSLIFATQVNSKWTTGDAAGAYDASKKAKTWALVGTILGVVGLGLYIALLAAGVITASSYSISS